MVVRKAVSISDPTMAASLQKLAGQDLGAGFDSDLADAVLVGTGGDNVVTDVQLYPEFNISGDSSSQKFSIRGYVSMLRSNDIGKNWPFSRKYLQICLENGRKPLLPPLEPANSVRDLIHEEVKFEARVYGNDTERENLSSEEISGKFNNDSKHSHDNDFVLQENEDGERKEADLRNNGRITSDKPWQCLPVSLACQAGGTACREDAKVTRNGDGCDVAINKAEEVEGFTGEDKQGPRARPILCTGDKGDGELKTAGKTEYKDSETETHRSSQQKDGQFRVKRTNSELSSKQRRKRIPPSEISSDVKTGFPTCNKQANKMLTTSETKSQEEINRGQKEVRKREHNVEQSKAEPGRTEDFMNSGSIIPDGGMLINVCPVCRTFSSTSNTALNAHMDHCLAVEPKNEKTVSSKFTKHKMKARKKRSMADICAVAPIRTLEDLEHSTAEQLALDDSNPLELDNFKWNDCDIRRQRRTPLYRAAKKYIGYVNPKDTNRENSSNLKTECPPSLQKEKQKECPPFLQKEKQKECPPFLQVKLVQSHGMRKNKRSTLGDFTGASQSSSSLTLIKVKVPKASPANGLNECIPQDKSRIQSQETAMEEKLPSSVNASAWTCLNKQGSSRTKKFKHKLVSLNLAGFGQRHCNEEHGVQMDMLELKDKSHLESLALSQGPVVESKESPGRTISHLSDKEHDPPVIVPSKRNRAKQTTKVLGINSTSSVEVEEFCTSKRMKNLSSLNFQKMAGCTATRGQSSVCLTKSPTSEKGQGEEVSFLYQGSIEKVRHDPPDSAQLSVNETLNSQKSGSVAASKLLENGAGSSVHVTQSSVHSQGRRIKPKELFSQERRFSNLKSAAGLSLKRSGLEFSNMELKRLRQCNLSSQKMKKVAHIMHDSMNVEDVTKDDVWKTAHNPDSSRESHEFIYDAGSTSNRAYSIKLGDCMSSKAQQFCATEISSLDGEPRASPDLQSVAMSASEYVPNRLGTSLKTGQAEMASEIQAQLDSTVSTICEASQMSCAGGAVAIDENMQHCMLKDTTVDLISLSNQPSDQQDAIVEGIGNQVIANLSPRQRKFSSEFCGAVKYQLNPCSSGEHTDIYVDDCLGKETGSQSNSQAQLNCVKNALKERVSSIPLENQRHKLSIQMDISCADSENGADATLKPFNKNPGSDSTDHMTHTTNICSMASKSFESHSSVHHFNPPEAPTISNEIIALNSDGIRVSLVSNDTYSADKPIISSELTAENEGASMPSLRNLNEGPPAMPQSFGFLQRPIFVPSIQTSSCTTSVGLPLTSQGSLFQERAMLLQDPQLVGNGNCSFGTRMSLNSVAMPQVIAPSLLSGNSGEIYTAGEVIHGSVLNPTPSKPHSVPNGVGKSFSNISARFLEEQKRLKQPLGNSSFGVTDGMNGTFAGNDVFGSSTQISNYPNHMSALTRYKSGVHSGNQFTESNMVSSSASDTATTQTGFPQRFSLENVNCSREPSVVHIFGNPILRLMGKNVMVSSKDGIQVNQVESSMTKRSDGLLNSNYVKPVEARPEAKFGQNEPNHLLQALERCVASDQNLLQSFEDGTGKDSNMLQPFEAEKRKDLGYFLQANDYREQKPTVPEKFSEVYDLNLAGSAFQSLTAARFYDNGPHLRSLVERPLSYVPPELIHNGLLHCPLNMFHHARQQFPSAARPQSDPEAIIADDTVNTEPTSNDASSVPTFLHGVSHQLQESNLMSTQLKSNSMIRSENRPLQSSNSLNHFLTEKARTLAYSSNVLSEKDILSEMRNVGINFHGNQ